MLAAAGAGLHAACATPPSGWRVSASATSSPTRPPPQAYAEGHRRYRALFDALADRFGELA